MAPDAIGPFWVNDVSARPDMICAAASLGLPYIAMHGFTKPDGRGGMSAGRATYPQVPWSETGRQTTPDTAPESGMADAVFRFFEAFARGSASEKRWSRITRSSGTWNGSSRSAGESW